MTDAVNAENSIERTTATAPAYSASPVESMATRAGTETVPRSMPRPGRWINVPRKTNWSTTRLTPRGTNLPTFALADAPWLPIPRLPSHPAPSLIVSALPRKSPHQSRQSRRARGLLTTGDPSLPTADSRALDEPLPQPESQGNSQRDLPRTRSGNHPDARIRASGRGKARSHPSGSSRSVQLRLDDFQYHPQSQPQAQVAGPSRQSMLSQDITALINPSANPFAPIAPPDTDDLDSAAPPDTQLYPPSSDPPLSPVPSQP